MLKKLTIKFKIRTLIIIMIVILQRLIIRLKVMITETQILKNYYWACLIINTVGFAKSFSLIHLFFSEGLSKPLRTKYSSFKKTTFSRTTTHSNYTVI